MISVDDDDDNGELKLTSVVDGTSNQRENVIGRFLELYHFSTTLWMVPMKDDAGWR